MTPPSLIPRTPVSSIDKPFYNPFTVDISLDATNIPITGAYNINSQFNDEHNNNNPKCKVISLGRSSSVGKRWSLFSLFSPRHFKITSGHQCHKFSENWSRNLVLYDITGHYVHIYLHNVNSFFCKKNHTLFYTIICIFILYYIMFIKKQ